MTVLVVDDDPLVLTNMAAMLEDLGHTVFEAASASEALAILSRESTIPTRADRSGDAADDESAIDRRDQNWLAASAGGVSDWFRRAPARCRPICRSFSPSLFCNTIYSKPCQRY
jgi:CheY-like chemotaxis protein